MVDRNQLGPVSNPQRAPTPLRTTAPALKGGGSGWLLVGGFVLLALAIGRCSTSGGGTAGNATAAQEAGNAQQAIQTAISAQTPPPVQALDKAAARRGVAHVALVSAKEGLAGEMIYSQNCYDALAHAFAWRKLDACGAFDAAAAQAVAGDEAATGPEAAWFQSETAAGRYLKAATAAGLQPDAADQRLAAMQARVGARKPPKAVPTPTAAPDGIGGSDGRNAAEPGADDATADLNALSG